jgi:UDP-2,4-diacetamido-2,4,6-trideoxy-beta-L-altropyranose hydrolase
MRVYRSDTHLSVEMNIVFRTDASLQIGTGHVMRCLTLAQALRERGARCEFISRAHPGNLIGLIRQRGFTVHELQCDHDWSKQENMPSHAGWLGADWQADAEQSKVRTGKTAIDWLIVDHYALDKRWETVMRANCRRIMIIDDLADRKHDCDILLDQNLGHTTKNYTGLIDTKAQMLIGPKYALLRPEFSALRAKSLGRRLSNPQLRHLLVAMGGVDKDNSTGRVLAALQSCHLPADLRVKVIMGLHAPWLTQVQAQATHIPCQTEVLVGVNDMAHLMAESDLAIGAAGGTAWERCSLGLPSLLLVLAQNQLSGALALQNAGAAIAIETDQQISSIVEQLQIATFAKETLAKMSKAAALVTDGEGCRRTVLHLHEGAYV